jgi:hypothetical protein
MQLLTILTALSTLTSLANSADASPSEAYVPAENLNELAKLMPASALPPPNGLDLKYILLGIGTQNYTCTDGDENKVPGTTGAVGKIEFHQCIEATIRWVRKAHQSSFQLCSCPAEEHSATCPSHEAWLSLDSSRSTANRCPSYREMYRVSKVHCISCFELLEYY